MQKWEYLRILSFYRNKEWRVLFINDDEVSDQNQATTLTKYLNEAGDQGWELVNEFYEDFSIVYDWQNGSSFDVKKNQEHADANGEKGWRVGSITSFSWGATGPGGGWLIDYRQKRRVLTFKRQKA